MSDELKWEVCSSDVEDTDDYKPSAEKIISLYESICKGKVSCVKQRNMFVMLTEIILKTLMSFL